MNEFEPCRNCCTPDACQSDIKIAIHNTRRHLHKADRDVNLGKTVSEAYSNPVVVRLITENFDEALTAMKDRKCAFKPPYLRAIISEQIELLDSM